MGTEPLITTLALLLCVAIIIAAMLTIVASGYKERNMNDQEFEEWRRANPGAPINRGKTLER